MTSIAFDRAASFYDETRGFPPGVEKQAAVLIAETGQLTRDTRVLEIGVGTGRIALPLAPHVKVVYGIDLARPMLERLRSKQTDEHVDLVEGNAEILPYADASFEAAVGVHVFHLIPGWRRVLDELARVLQPDGHLIHAWVYHSPDDIWTIWNRDFAAKKMKTVGVSRQEYDTFLSEAGWRKFGERHTLTYQASIVPNDLLERIERRMMSSMWQMPDEEIAEGGAYMRKLLRERYSDPSQVVMIERNFVAEAYMPPAS